MLIFFILNTHAQYIPQYMTLNPGEKVTYDVYLKWGILMPHAGVANISFNKTSFKGQPASRYRLSFHTANIFETVFKMRDTLNCFYNADNTLLHSLKHTVEGGYDSTDELTFKYDGLRTSIHSVRYTPTVTKIDTTLQVASGYTSDMLGATFYLRTIDWKNMKIGDTFTFTVAIGRDLVPITYRYQGQSVVERGNVKFRTHYVIIDIHDEAFTETKASAEVWLGDDDNHIPIKIRTKIKVGYAEVHYKSSENLKAPLDCRVELKK
ncbi:MAG: DUF3108 domain-containing protein [Tannerella sp.]|nr:DUF3108 domain-containing protein [Tannerella sp.]